MENDIDWVLSCPSLINTPSSFTPFKDIIDINETGSTTADIPNFRARNLGGYYENIVSFIINKNPYPSDIKRNIKVYENKITLGEFDFIGRSPIGDFHLECAIKYYLRTGTGTNLKDFIGPGKKDRLDIKYQRMIEHQLNLSKTPQGSQACSQEGISPSIFIMLIQGYLFHPFTEFGAKTDLHSAINPSHLQGWWLRQHELSKLKGADHYLVMRKPNWLVADRSNPRSYEHLESELLTADRPTLVARFDKSGEEIDRGFVVPNGW